MTRCSLSGRFMPATIVIYSISILKAHGAFYRDLLRYYKSKSGLQQRVILLYDISQLLKRSKVAILIN
jgi:hypothetical protein